jgi:hypothetical protein
MVKYFLCVFAIFKNEAVIFKEWLDHYINEGVEHFYLIDNGSTDNYKEIIKDYEDKITLFEDPKRHDQVGLYNKHVLPLVKETEWLIGCDFDEFIWATNGTIASTLKTVDEDIGMIEIPWQMFGSAGHIEQPKFVVPSFTKRMNCEKEFVINAKSIARGKWIRELNVHFFNISYGRTVDARLKDRDPNPNGEISEDILENSLFRLNHYAIQSYNWFKEVKSTRGDVASSHVEDIRNDKYFKDYDYNDKEDTGLSDKNKELYEKLNKATNENENFLDYSYINNDIYTLNFKKVNNYTLIISLILLILIGIIIYMYI